MQEMQAQGRYVPPSLRTGGAARGVSMTDPRGRGQKYTIFSEILIPVWNKLGRSQNFKNRRLTWNAESSYRLWPLSRRTRL